MPSMDNPPSTLLPKLLIAALLVVGLVGAGLGLNWLLEQGALGWVVAANRWLATNFIERLGYLGVFALMFIESSFIPFPSEIIMPPAGDLARRLPDWSLGMVIFLGVAGSLAGGLFNYWLARRLGRPVVMALISRYGRLVRLREKDYERAEAFFLRHGGISTFTGRLLPGIRQIISLPAGLAGMNLTAFIAFTTAGAAFWVVVLTLLGYWFGSEPELLADNMKLYTRWLLAGALVVLGLYVGVRLLRNRGRREEGRGQ